MKHCQPSRVAEIGLSIKHRERDEEGGRDEERERERERREGKGDILLPCLRLHQHHLKKLIRPRYKDAPRISGPSYQKTILNTLQFSDPRLLVHWLIPDVTDPLIEPHATPTRVTASRHRGMYVQLSETK